MRQKPLPWPPKAGEIWVAVSEWPVTHVANNRSAPINAGDKLLVLSVDQSLPIEITLVDDSTVSVNVQWSGGARRLFAAPKDLMPLEWLVDT